MALPLILAAAAPLIGSAIGSAASAGDKRAAAAASARALQYLESVGVPSIEAQQILLQNPDFIGQFAPEAEQTMDAGPSRMEDISVDPRLKDAQMQALASLQEQGQTPLTATERAQLGGMRRDVAQEAQARQNLILQNMSERGAGGSGMELAARLQASQSSAQRQGEESDRMAAMAQERALAAIAQGGQLGGRIREQEVGEQERVASAADEITKFNLQNRMSVQQRNVGARNEARLREAEERQRLENLRAATANEQQKYNKELLRKQYQDRLDKARLMSGQANTQAQGYRDSAAATAQNWQSMGEGAGKIGSTIATGLTKESIDPTDLNDDGTLASSVAPKKKKPGVVP